MASAIKTSTRTSLSTLSEGTGEPPSRESNASLDSPILTFLERRLRSKTHKAGSLVRRTPTPHRPFRVVRAAISETHVTYYIAAALGSLHWTFATRYRLLRELHEQLRAKYGSRVPTFPEKRLFGNLRADFVTRRSDLLERYLNEVCANEMLFRSKAFQAFLNQSKRKALRFQDYQSIDKFSLDG